ncbi:class-II fumarase/aspartase family protein [Ensifer canadensis]|uniref:class-II fumarase/aspartase family protein n=1 Tax=Ensifer canadensis TaxID=555315 RepID=UPI001AEF346A|nr:adenylosuccinate lyase family protein [Ensifer canadensis]
MINSRIFGHLWSTSESHAIFGEQARVARWLDVIIALAEAQAECGVIPKAAAAEISALRGRELPIETIAERTRTTGHSTLGLILTLRELLTPTAAEYVYYGATVQDITDTSQVLEIRAVGSLLWRDLRIIEEMLLALASEHRETPMAGRTHGQIGSPISFGFKVASWADEIGRHIERLHDGRRRWLVGQFAGAVGTLGFFDEWGLTLRSAFCRRLSLGEPAISWLSARDRVVEFAHVIATTATSLARIGNEVYNLQRQEIGELRERASPSTVGSITMPHKRNPEGSEQIVTLAQTARAQAGILADAMVHEHERDGRTWKVEWAAFPALSHCVLSATSLSKALLSGLEVDAPAMERNLAIVSASESMLSIMAARIGKHHAQHLLQSAFLDAKENGVSLPSVLAEKATEEELALLSSVELGSSAKMVDQVVHSARRRRSFETESWQ